MKIAIHHREGSFSHAWIEYCKKSGIEYKIVNAFDTDIIDQIKDCDVFMWHHHHNKYKDTKLAKKLLFAIEHSGIKVFPDFKTNWHFDDKVAQKYLLEAIGAPLVPSYAFYDKKQAIVWAKQTNYPKVFKLKGGAGASNVKLVKSKSEALKLINKAFTTGFPQFDRLGYLKEITYHFKGGDKSIRDLCGGFVRSIVSTEYGRKQDNEKGYVYFQDFIASNEYDIRVIVTGDKAIAAKRYVRKNDFRASGSGNKSHKRQDVNEKFVAIAFEINRLLQMQSVSFDFAYNSQGEPLVIEISYGFPIAWPEFSPGYWDSDLNWYEEKPNPCAWMIEGIVGKSF